MSRFRPSNDLTNFVAKFMFNKKSKLDFVMKKYYASPRGRFTFLLTRRFQVHDSNIELYFFSLFLFVFLLYCSMPFCVRITLYRRALNTKTYERVNGQGLDAFYVLLEDTRIFEWRKPRVLLLFIVKAS